jgi:hypothetical protein
LFEKFVSLTTKFENFPTNSAPPAIKA